MAAPRIKVFDSNGIYQACTHDYAAAGCLVAFYGDGATVRLGHRKADTVFTQGTDGDAGQCYELVADAIAAEDARVEANLRAMLAGSK